MHDIIDDYIENPSPHGICNILYWDCDPSTRKLYLQTMISILKSKGWYSGDDMYPISHPDNYHPQLAFENENLWDPDTEYGRRRIYVARQLADMKIKDRHERRMIKIKRLCNEALSKLLKVFKRRN